MLPLKTSRISTKGQLLGTSLSSLDRDGNIAIELGVPES